MGKRVQWIEYQGERIIFCDYTNIQHEEEFLRGIEEMGAKVLKEEPGTFILMLIDVTGSLVTAKVTEKARAVAAAARARGIPSSPTAIVGVSGPAKKAIVLAMQFLRPDLHTTESIAAAKDWLISRVEK